MGDIDFKFTDEQKERFNNILIETKKEYPHLLADDIVSYRTKVLIAHNVIFGDDAYDKEEKEKESEEEKREEFIELS